MIILGLIFLGLSVLFVFWTNYKIESESDQFITSDISALPKRKTGLVLGTGKTLANGARNPYFFYRIQAAAALYKSGKINSLIVSGDNSQPNYNEPFDMKEELVKAGVPGDKIYEDFAGFRTLDSVIRAKEIFGQKSFIIISQRFHNERAVFLARENGIDAYGYNAKDVNSQIGFKTNLREKFAKAKVFWDFLFDVEPKFGGKKVDIK